MILQLNDLSTRERTPKCDFSPPLSRPALPPDYYGQVRVQRGVRRLRFERLQGQLGQIEV